MSSSASPCAVEGDRHGMAGAQFGHGLPVAAPERQLEHPDVALLVLAPGKADPALMVADEKCVAHRRGGDFPQLAGAHVHAGGGGKHPVLAVGVPQPGSDQDVFRIASNGADELRRAAFAHHLLDQRTGGHAVLAKSVQHGRACSIGIDRIQLAGGQRAVVATQPCPHRVHHAGGRDPPEVRHRVFVALADQLPLLVGQANQRQQTVAIHQGGGGKVLAVRRNLHGFVLHVPCEIGKRYRFGVQERGAQQHQRDQPASSIHGDFPCFAMCAAALRGHPAIRL